ncbi:MAG: response regulator [Anaerolineales bacterium]|jgi:DNA-binding NarL/FixJ family response regulator
MAILKETDLGGTCTIRVLILDDQLVQREGIARIVESTGTMHVMVAAGTAEEAYKAFQITPIDLALIDLVLREQNGTLIGRHLRQLHPNLKVIIYTREKSMVLAAEIIKERKDIAQPGLQGYILTRNISSIQYLQSVYEQILEDGYFIDPDVLRWHYELAKIEPLTRREEECALMLANGVSNPEIANRMCISIRRVENMVSNLYLKFQIIGDPGDPARRVLLAEGIKLLQGRITVLSSINVLIVDDNQEYLTYLNQEINEKNRLKVIGTAKTGQGAIDLTIQQSPNLVLMDINLPDMNGFQAARQILIERPKTKVILQSADPNEIYQEETQRTGAIGLLHKNKVTADSVIELYSPLVE